MATQYMSVPEKIELTNSGTATAGGYPAPPSDNTYKPMKIPDTITLETNDPPVVGPGRGVSGEVRGGASGEGRYLGEVKRTEDIRQVQPIAEDVSREKLAPNTSSDRPPNTNHGATPDLEQRVRTLESKVQRLTETFLSSQRNEPAHRENKYGFWYVVTFAGWMMVPLIVVCMYQLKK